MTTVTIKIGETIKQVALDHALPMVMQDWRELAKHGVTLTTLREVRLDENPEPMMQFVAHVLAKAGEPADVCERMTLKDFTQASVQVLGAVLDAEGLGEIDRPTSGSSMSSPLPMAGDQTSLES